MKNSFQRLSVRRWSSRWRLPFALLSGLLTLSAARAEDVATVVANDGRTSAKWSGEILDYSGRELRMRLATGREKAFPAARVLGISTPTSGEQQAADAALAKAEFRRALERYRAALDGSHESRDWVRRQILAQIVWCQRGLGQWDAACESFLLLLSRDPKTPYFDAIPLAWTPAEPPPALEQKAKTWLAQAESPAARLLGASHLLSTGSRPAAVEQLKRLALDRDPQIALLAQAQLWRTTAFGATDEQLQGWRRALDKVPDSLRAGPDFVVGSASAARHPEAAAILLLRVPVLYPRERTLAAAALLRSGQMLENLNRPAEATTLYGELAQNYSDRPEAAEAAKRLAGTRLSGAPAAVAPATGEPDRGTLDERFLAGLRRRGLFALGEAYCRSRLDDPELIDAARAELAIDLARSLAEHALAVRPEEREPIWREASATTLEFANKYGQNPRILLVRMQAALVLLAKAELERQETEIGSQAVSAGEPVRATVRAAIAALKQLDTDIAGEMRRRTRASGAIPGQLSEAELTSLTANVRYQHARGLRNQAFCYPAGSDDRINSLTQALELLAPLSGGTIDDPLVWLSRVDELVCLRLLGRAPDAAKRLIELEKLDTPAALQPRLRAEGVRLLLAGGKPNEALKAADGPGPEAISQDPELDFARLEAMVALWRKAADEGSQSGAAEWEKRASAEVEHIESLHGPYWMRRAETLLASALAKAARAESLEGLTRAAVSYYRGGQLDEALAAYDEAARQAEAKGQPDQAFEIGLAAAAIEHQRQHFHDARLRFQRLALAMPKHPKAAQAHLAAIYDEAAAAQADKNPLDVYRQLLAEHMATWPESANLGQVAVWLGKLCEHDRRWQAAADAYRAVPREQAQYADAVLAAANCYERLLAEQRAAGHADAQQARDAARWLEQVIAGPAGKPAAAWTPLERQAALSAARLWMNDASRGAVQAEDLLNTALEHSADAPAEWQTSAHILLITALASQGRFDEAVAALDKISGGEPADLLLMLDGLSAAAEHVEGNLKRQLAGLELKTIDALGARANPLGETERKRLDQVRVRALAETGERKAAVDLADNLAQRFPKDGQVQEELAALLSQTRDPDELRRALGKWNEVAQKSRAGTPRWFRANLGLAQAHLALGKPPRARAVFKLVEAGHPDFGGDELRAQFQKLLAECDK
jgi:hypothetical protein